MDRRFSFLVPDDWWRIPLVDEQERSASINRLVDQQCAAIDDAEELRQQLKQELTATAEVATVFGGVVMAIHLASINNKPVTATMTCYDLSGFLSLPPQIDPATVLNDFVGDGHEQQETKSTSAAWEKVPRSDVIAYRKEAVTSESDQTDEDRARVPQLLVTYMQIVKDFGLVQTVFTSPNIQGRDSWIPMFDAMIAGFRATVVE